MGAETGSRTNTHTTVTVPSRSWQLTLFGSCSVVLTELTTTPHQGDERWSKTRSQTDRSDAPRYIATPPHSISVFPPAVHSHHHDLSTVSQCFPHPQNSRNNRRVVETHSEHTDQQRGRTEAPRKLQNPLDEAPNPFQKPLPSPLPSLHCATPMCHSSSDREDRSPLQMPVRSFRSGAVVAISFAHVYRSLSSPSCSIESFLFVVLVPDSYHYRIHGGATSTMRL